VSTTSLQDAGSPLSSAVALAALLCAQARAYPANPLRMIVNFPPGGSVGFMGSVIAQKLSEALGQPVVGPPSPIFNAGEAPEKDGHPWRLKG
jgi:hypothetical protein